MPTISVTQEVYEELKKISQSWEDTPTKIIARLLEMDRSKRSHNLEASSHTYTPPLPPEHNPNILPSSPPPQHPIRETSKNLRERTSPSSIVKKIIMLVLAEEGPGMVDPKRVQSETEKIMKLNNLITDKDLETTPSGRTRLVTKISRLQSELISKGLASSAEGMWLLTMKGREESEKIKKKSRLITGKENGSNLPRTPKVTYRHTRLCFFKEKIEGLEAEETFRVICNDGIFQMTKNEFYEVFENIVSTRSYRERGIYHSPKAPQKAMKFKIL